MKQYFLSIVIVSVIGSVISIIAPEGEGGGLSRHVSLAVGVCLILVCFAPAADAVEWLRELDLEAVFPESEGEVNEYESIFDSAYSQAEIGNLCEGIKGAVSQRFGIDPTCLSVSVRLGEGGRGKTLESVFVTLYDSAIWADTGEIESYLSSLLGCEIITIIG